MAQSKKYRINKQIHSKKKRTMKQKLWHMKGCAKNHSRSKCKECGWTPQMGGCNSCQLQHGGFYKPPAPIPGPFIGQNWSPKVEGWPGVNGVGADRNYLAENLYPTDPQTMMIVNGGRRLKRYKRMSRMSKRMSRMKKGGGFIPQDLVNLGRNVSFNMGSAYNALNGYPAPVNPLPYKDQLINNSRLI